jgi:hypothetical protein
MMFLFPKIIGHTIQNKEARRATGFFIHTERAFTVDVSFRRGVPGGRIVVKNMDK